ncbi:hypothetical protein [Streptomyces nigrescens]|uniref:Lipoprotein n=1 Tax=Streptomyces nigrescens TaxID=1920 RepID=A0ABY7IYM9_STRNI|nr:hypothetical protein [Streptomyces nigrescens]WAU03790.1 hypothetical protein STRNI_001978 [Streptomyces nigrescens]
MKIRNRSRAVGRVRLAALLALPMLVLSTACSGENGGVKTVQDVASSPGDAASGNKSSGKQGGTGDKGAFYDAQVKYVQCMRGEGGIKDFPDPKLSGYLDYTKIEEVARKSGNEEMSKGPKDGKKEKPVCGKEKAAAERVEPKRDAEKEYESLLSHAKCMREHGVSKFSNPTMSDGHVIPGGDANPAASPIDPDSPAYRQAREACKDKLLDGLDGMQ